MTGQSCSDNCFSACRTCPKRTCNCPEMTHVVLQNSPKITSHSSVPAENISALLRPYTKEVMPLLHCMFLPTPPFLSCGSCWYWEQCSDAACRLAPSVFLSEIPPELPVSSRDIALLLHVQGRKTFHCFWMDAAPPPTVHMGIVLGWRLSLLFLVLTEQVTLMLSGPASTSIVAVYVKNIPLLLSGPSQDVLPMMSVFDAGTSFGCCLFPLSTLEIKLSIFA